MLLSFASCESLVDLLDCVSLKTTKKGLILLSGSWFFLTIALMQPRANPREIEKTVHQNKSQEKSLNLDHSHDAYPSLKSKSLDIVFLLDTSASMSVSDTRVGQSRLDYAKEIIDETLSRLKGETAALYAFTSEVTKLVPSTYDHLYLRFLLRDVKINEGDVAGTDLVEALDVICKRHFKKNKKKNNVLVLFTDGGDTRLEGLEGEKRIQQESLLLGRLEGVEALNLRVFTVAMGTRQGEVIKGMSYQGKPVHSSLDEKLLENLAKKGGGKLFLSNDYSSLSLANTLIQSVNESVDWQEVNELDDFAHLRLENKQSKERRFIYDEYFRWPLFFGIILLFASLSTRLSFCPGY